MIKTTKNIKRIHLKKKKEEEDKFTQIKNAINERILSE